MVRTNYALLCVSSSRLLTVRYAFHAVKKERAIQLVTLDPHGPNEMRCNGTLSNVPEFLEVSTFCGKCVRS